MKDKGNHDADRWGLLANGSSSRWELAVDESLDREEWLLEIDSPQLYLVLQMQDLSVPGKTLDFLQTGLQTAPSTDGAPRGGEEAGFVLGRFGDAPVSLLWDDEEVPRCFLIIGPNSRATLRLSLDAADVQMWIDALRQVLKGLPQNVA